MANVLEVKNVAKRYGKTVALDGIDLTMNPGEVLGIAGPNGAGKSTLARILAGEDGEDGGEILLAGKPWSHEQRRHSVAIVHQEVRLFPTLTVQENLLVGRAGRRYLRPAAGQSEYDILKEFNLAGMARVPLENCSLVVQQLVEIARAILRSADAFLFDEPNSALTLEESERLFDHIHRLRAEGNAPIALVSHRLADLAQHCDRVVVIRDGKVAREFSGAELTTANIAQAMVAKNGSPAAETHAAPQAHRRERREFTEPLLRVSNWSDAAGKTFAGVNLAVHRGEAVFITGQEGAGGRELIQSLARLRRARGKLELAERDDAKGSGTDSCYLPGNRATSLFANMSIRGNLSARLGEGTISTRVGVLRLKRLNEMGRRWVERLSIRSDTPRQAIGSLSGGNQQKVAVGSVLAATPSLLLIEEPTRGVDVATKAEIYAALREYAWEGNAVVGFSPELDEVFEIADTVYVASGGRLSPALDASSVKSLEELADLVDRARTAQATQT